MADYFDDEDLINDYVDDFEPPPEYDEDMPEEMMGGETISAAANNAKPDEVATPATPTLIPTSTETQVDRTRNLFSSHDRGEDAMDEESSPPPAATEPTNVTEYISQQRPQHNIYKFERYVSCLQRMDPFIHSCRV